MIQIFARLTGGALMVDDEFRHWNVVALKILDEKIKLLGCLFDVPYG